MTQSLHPQSAAAGNGSRMIGLLTAALFAVGMGSAAVAAQAEKSKTPAKSTKASRSSPAKPVAVAETPPAEVDELINPGQLDVAARVLIGTADCEFKQQITLAAVDGRPGYFDLAYQGKRYRMVPRETVTGAVRLENPHEGLVWLQIPAKSMLMSAKLGKRLVDYCTLSEQRAAITAVRDAASSLGIEPPAGAPGSSAMPMAAGSTSSKPMR